MSDAGLGPLQVPESVFALLRGSDGDTVICRALVLAQHVSADAAARYLRETRAAALGESGEAAATGVQVLHKQAALVLLEGPSEALHEFCFRLHRDAQSGGSPFTAARVACLCDDVPARVFQTWSEAMITVPKEANVGLPEDSLTGSIGELYSRTLAIGAALGKSLTPNRLEDCKNRSGDLFCSQERILAMIKHQHITTVEEFFELYGTSVDAQTLGDDVWPMQALEVDLQL
jgi:hypothetical protein